MKAAFKSCSGANKEITRQEVDDLTYMIIGAAIEVHRNLGPGLLESVYEKCMLFELKSRGLSVFTQQRVPISYKGISMEAELRYDILVEDLIVVELKATEGLLPIHEAVLLTYMKLLQKPKGVLINFNCTNIFRNGQRTLVNDIYSQLD